MIAVEMLRPCLAELVLLAGFFVLLVLSRVPSARHRAGDIALLVFATAAVGAVASMDAQPGWIAEPVLVVDPFGTFFKFVLAMCAMGEVWMCSRVRAEPSTAWQWSWVALVASLLAMFAMVSAVHVAASWAGFAVASMGSALWMGWRRGRTAATGEAVAALLQGAVASSTALLGFALLFGLAGTLSYAGLSAKLPLALAMPGGRAVLLAGVVLVLAGLASRIAVVAWHPWRAGAAERVPVAVSAWLETAGTIAVLAMVARLLRSTLADVSPEGHWTMLPGIDWPPIVAVASGAAMTMGNLAALRATNLKRLVAWLSIAQAGYLLMGLAVAGDDGLEGMLFHLVAYALMTGGLLAALAPVIERGGSAGIDVLRGLARVPGHGRVLAAATAVFVLSYAAVPPLAGYAGKVFLLTEVFRSGGPVFGAVAALNSAIGLVCCARVGAMLFDRPADGVRSEPLAIDPDALLLVALLAAGTIGIGLWPGALASFASRSVVFFGG